MPWRDLEPLPRWGVWWRDEEGREGWVLSRGLSSPPWETHWRNHADARCRSFAQATPITGTVYEVRPLGEADRIAS